MAASWSRVSLPARLLIRPMEPSRHPDPPAGRFTSDPSAQVCAALSRLKLVCGLDPDPKSVWAALRAATRPDLPADESPEERLMRGAASCGLRARPVRLTVREAVHHARAGQPLALVRKLPDGSCQHLVIERHGWSRARVSGLGPEPVVISLSALERQVGGGGRTAMDWIAVHRDLPAEALSGTPPSGGAGHDGNHGDGNGNGHPAAHPSPFRRLAALARLERRDLWSLLGYAVVTGILYLAVPLAADALVSNIAFGGQQQAYIQALLFLGIALAAFLLLHAFVRALAFLVIERLQRRLFARFTADLALRLPRVRQSEFDRYHGPELTNRFFDIMTLQKASAQLLLDGLDVTLTFLVGSMLLAFYDWTLFWFDAGLLVLVLLIIWRLGREGVNTSIEESRIKYATAGWLQQVAMFSTVFKGPGGSDLAADWTDDLTRNYLKARQAHFRILFRQVVGLMAVEVAATVVLLGWGGLLVLEGQLSIGQLVGSQLVLTATLAAVAKFWKQLETAYDCLTAIDKVGYLVDLRMESPEGEAPRMGSPRGAEVVIRDLCFEYTAHRPVLDGFQLHLKPGDRLALIAPASSGSTTLLNLLYGLREPTSGHVDIDGLDVRHWRRSELRRQVARVHGDDEIFDGSIADNVRLGNTALGLAEVREALAATRLLPKVQGLRRGLVEPISLLGRSLSGTERRQILLARAIISQPRLLLLDATLDGFEPDDIDGIVEYLADPARPWTLVVVTRDPDVIRRFRHQVRMQPIAGNPRTPHGY